MSTAGKLYAQQTGATRIIVMRHAEKEIQEGNPDPDLSAAGKNRAQRLVTLLKSVKIDRLYATPYKRTQQTLAALAANRSLGIKMAPEKAEAFARLLLAATGETIVVAAHANSAPRLVNELTGTQDYMELKEEEFGKIWIVTISDQKAVSSIELNTN